MGNSRSIKIYNETDDDIIQVQITSDNTVFSRNDSIIVPRHSSRVFAYKTTSWFQLISHNLVETVWRLVRFYRNWCRVLVKFQNSGTDDFVITSETPTPNVEFRRKPHKVDVTPMKDKKGYQITLRSRTPPRTHNQRAEQFRQEGIQAMAQNRFTEARNKFEKAHQIATDEKTKQAIKSSIAALEPAMEKRAEEMHAEGTQLMRNDLFDEALKRFRESLKLTKKPHTIEDIKNSIREAQKLKFSDNKALKLLENGDTLMESHEYDKALRKYKVAGEAATKSATRDRISAAINKVQQM